MTNYYVHARLATGPYKGKGHDDLLIPRIKFLPEDRKMPFEMQRIQFPIRLGFAITHFRVQGGTFKKVGINLSHQLFGHGHLYVALSRVGSGKRVKIFQPKDDKTKGYMRNVVYPEVLTDDQIFPNQPNVDENPEVVPETEPFFPPPDPSIPRLSLLDQIDQLTDPRLEEAGFERGEYTKPDGNCFLWALKDQMR